MLADGILVAHSPRVTSASPQGDCREWYTIKMCLKRYLVEISETVTERAQLLAYDRTGTPAARESAIAVRAATGVESRIFVFSIRRKDFARKSET
jgi:hypothetical protein